MAVKVNIFITTSNEGSGAYGIRADNDEQVYVPHSIAEKLELEEFDEIETILVTNPGRPTPPWMATKARRIGDPSSST